MIFLDKKRLQIIQSVLQSRAWGNTNFYKGFRSECIFNHAGRGHSGLKNQFHGHQYTTITFKLSLLDIWYFAKISGIIHISRLKKNFNVLFFVGDNLWIFWRGKRTKKNILVRFFLYFGSFWRKNLYILVKIPELCNYIFLLYFKNIYLIELYNYISLLHFKNIFFNSSEKQT